MTRPDTSPAIDSLLDQALEDTFPASDPVALCFGYDLLPERSALIRAHEGDHPLV